jgi:hypothetical protein
MQKISLRSNDPTLGFWRNQYCIAELACQQRHTFENTLWWDTVLELFIQAYVKNTRRWPDIIAHCEKRSSFNPLRNLLCQRDMAYYHIYKDLPDALNQAGCSTKADWQKLEGYINHCIQQVHYPPLISQYIQNRVIHYRNEVRNTCITKTSLTHNNKRFK